jgi:hypothetical protein
VCGCSSPVAAGSSGALLSGVLDSAFAQASPPSDSAAPVMPSSSPDLGAIPGKTVVDIGLGLLFLLAVIWAVEKSTRRGGE